MKKIKLLTLWLLTLIWLGSFCNADYTNPSRTEYSFNTAENRIYFEFTVNSWVVCYMPQWYWTNSNFKLAFLSWWFDNNSNLFPSTYYWYNMYCFDESFWIKYIWDWTLTNTNRFYIFNWILSNSFLESCQSEECDYSDYVPLSDYNTCLSDLNTATWNYQSCQSSISWYVNSLNNCSSNLNQCSTSLSSCLSANCPNNTWSVSWSALFINNIQHIWAPIIRMTIPEELSWDYAYTDSGNNMDIEIEGYNVDYDYINWVVNIQKYKPTTEDFTNIVSNLWSYFKILVFLLFAFIVIKWITKPFKSKLK